MRRNRQKEKTPDASGHMAAAPGVCCYLFVLVCEIEFLAVIVRIRHTFQLGKGLLGQRPHIPVHTRHTEFEILLLLAQNAGIVFSKEQIYDSVWEEPYFGDYNIVMSHIRNIREKIEDNPSKPIYIQTV